MALPSQRNQQTASESNRAAQTGTPLVLRGACSHAHEPQGVQISESLATAEARGGGALLQML